MHAMHISVIIKKKIKREQQAASQTESNKGFVLWSICFPLVKFPHRSLSCNRGHASGIYQKYHVTCMPFCTKQIKARPCLETPTRSQTQYSAGSALQDSHHKSRSPVYPILYPVTRPYDLNPYSLVAKERSRQCGINYSSNTNTLGVIKVSFE